MHWRCIVVLQHWVFATASLFFLFRHKKHSCSLGNIVLQYAQRTLVLPVVVIVVAAQRSKQLQWTFWLQQGVAKVRGSLSSIVSKQKWHSALSVPFLHKIPKSDIIVFGKISSGSGTAQTISILILYRCEVLHRVSKFPA